MPGKQKGRSLTGLPALLAPQLGLEPRTCRLTVARRSLLAWLAWLVWLLSWGNYQASNGSHAGQSSFAKLKCYQDCNRKWCVRLSCSWHARADSLCGGRTAEGSRTEGLPADNGPWKFRSAGSPARPPAPTAWGPLEDADCRTVECRIYDTCRSRYKFRSCWSQAFT